MFSVDDESKTEYTEYLKVHPFLALTTLSSIYRKPSYMQSTNTYIDTPIPPRD